ncbi:hypothetical protein M5D96_007847 [Drosophila gunungcola]|uniref:Uncharacterized protein n=1 Tax=Drosophila gunungcola TaxID=103775 RepID=A0A9P9YLC1_9MUSC|nr:hypothetical protein M5D96_007847 [Drosophila gunungcola]
MIRAARVAQAQLAITSKRGQSGGQFLGQAPFRHSHGHEPFMADLPVKQQQQRGIDGNMLANGDCDDDLEDVISHANPYLDVTLESVSEDEVQCNLADMAHFTSGK